MAEALPQVQLQRAVQEASEASRLLQQILSRATSNDFPRIQSAASRGQYAVCTLDAAIKLTERILVDATSETIHRRKMCMDLKANLMLLLAEVPYSPEQLAPPRQRVRRRHRGRNDNTSPEGEPSDFQNCLMVATDESLLAEQNVMFARLQQDIADVHELEQLLSVELTVQDVKLDVVAETVEEANTTMSKGVEELQQASTIKFAGLGMSLTGALIGAAIAGPVGFIAGLKSGAALGVCALAGAATGSAATQTMGGIVHSRNVRLLADVPK